MRAGPALAVLLIIAMLLPPSLAQEPMVDIGGVDYYINAGTPQSGHMMAGLDHTGQNQLPFVGCMWNILREETQNGLIWAQADLDGYPMEIEMTQFDEAVPGVGDGLASDIFVDGSRAYEGIQHPVVPAPAAAWGTAVMYVNTLRYADPVTGTDALEAYWFVTPDGFRDNETGAIVNEDGSPYEPGMQALLSPGDWEMHLRITSPGGPPLPPQQFQIEAPGGTPGYFTPNTEHRNLIPFNNVRFGGQAIIEIDTEAQALAGENELTFHFRAPNGTMLDSVTLTPALGASDSAEVRFPLDRFGLYYIEVEGQAELSKYTIDVTQETPSQFDLHFWWDDVTFGHDATGTRADCEEYLTNPAGEPVATVVDRQPPPPFQWIPIAIGAFGAVVAVLIAIKFTAMTLASVKNNQ